MSDKNLKVIKDETSKAVLNVDYTALDEYKKRKHILRKKNTQIESLTEEIEMLKMGLKRLEKMMLGEK